MKKMFIAIIAVFTLLTLFVNPASAQTKAKQATLVTGYQEGNYVENKMPFGTTITDKNVVKKDKRAALYWTVIRLEPLTKIPQSSSGVVALFQDQALLDTIKSVQIDSGEVILLTIAIIEPLTDWSEDLRKDWEEYLDKDGFDALKNFQMGWVVGYQIINKADLGPTGEVAGGKWVDQPFGGRKWVTD